jgi:carboxyl-terminal processing protease
MKYSLAVAFLALSLAPCFSQPSYDCHKIVQLKHLLDGNHIISKEWNETLSADVVDQLFYLLDPQARYFIEKEKNPFQKRFSNLLKSSIAGDCSFISEISAFYKNSLHRADGILDKITKTSLDFNHPDTIKYNLYGTLNLADETALYDRWVQIIKFEVLRELNSKIKSPEELKSAYKPAMLKACKRNRDIIKRRLTVEGGIEQLIFFKILNSISTVYDPHTQYFSPRESQAFMDHLSSEGYSYGVAFQEDAVGNVCVGRIVPGSSAWDSGKLNEGDVVLSLHVSSSEEIDATLYSVAELEELMSSMTGQMEFTVRKLTGEEVSVFLTKQKLRQDESKIKSLLLSGADYRLGYISLPLFYPASEFTGTGCANDLAKEILQLKKAQINGLIIDIRNNGGGSLEEAINLAGIFVDRGALAIEQTQNNEPTTLRDTNLGTAYNGPLIILINGGSASASELFAQAMRDHNRAIIMGSTTYGKGSGQIIVPFPGDQGDIIKITSFRFYDVKGGSHQGYGVRPDIELPDRFSTFQFFERNVRNYIAADRVTKKTYYTPLDPIPLNVLNDSTQSRIKKNPYFLDESQRADKLKANIRGGVFHIPLTWEGFNNLYTLFRETQPSTTAESLSIEMTADDQQVSSIDQYSHITYENLIKGVQSDFYIQEAANTLIEYIELTK